MAKQLRRIVWLLWILAQQRWRKRGVLACHAEAVARPRVWCLQAVPQHTDTEQRSCSLLFLASRTKALCYLFSGMILVTIMLQSWGHSVVLLPQTPLMRNEGFRGSGKMPPSHLSCSLVCSAGTRVLVWAGLPLGQGKWPKGFFACARRAVDMTRAAGIEWGLLFGIAFCLAFLSVQCMFLAQITAGMLSWTEKFSYQSGSYLTKMNWMKGSKKPGGDKKNQGIRD